MDFEVDQYYLIRALDHYLSIHADEELTDLTIQFVGKLIEINDKYLIFAFLEYSNGSRPDLFQCVKSTIIETQLLQIKT